MIDYNSNLTIAKGTLDGFTWSIKTIDGQDAPVGHKAVFSSDLKVLTFSNADVTRTVKATSLMTLQQYPHKWVPPSGWDVTTNLLESSNKSLEDCMAGCQDRLNCVTATAFKTYPGATQRQCRYFSKTLPTSKMVDKPSPWEGIWGVKLEDPNI